MLNGFMKIAMQVLGVEFYSSENTEQFDKPNLEKISEYPNELRNWDPTDDNPENPWIKYKQELKEKEEKQREYYNAAIQAMMNIINIRI